MQNVKDQESDNLYRNDNGSFTKVTDQAGLRSFGLTLSATIGDINNDSYPDIFVSNDFSSPDYMYINNQDGTFSDIIKESTSQTSFYGMGADIADFNNDFNLDYIQVDMDARDNRRSKANMASMNIDLFWSTVNYGFHYQYMHNTLQLNRGVFNGKKPFFSNVSRLSGISSTDWSWGPLFADFDNDGWKDIFISNGTRREINHRDYFNELKLRPMAKDSLLYYSQNIPSEAISNFIFQNNKDLSFSDVTEEWGLDYKNFSNGTAYADLDNDGDLEIIVNNIDQEAQIFNNNSSYNYIKIKLKGSDLNPFGIGARVFVKSSDLNQMQEMTLSRGFQSSVSPEFHFGLSDNTSIDLISIEWPNGNYYELANPEINQLITLDIKDSYSNEKTNSKNDKLLFVSEEIVEYKHIEKDYNDYEKELYKINKNKKFVHAIATEN